MSDSNTITLKEPATWDFVSFLAQLVGRRIVGVDVSEGNKVRVTFDEWFPVPVVIYTTGDDEAHGTEADSVSGTATV